MNKEKVVLTLGILVAVLPFLGFPGGFKTFLFVIFGILIAVSSFLSLKQGKISSTAKRSMENEVFEENIPEDFQDSEMLEDQNNLAN